MPSLGVTTPHIAPNGSASLPTIVNSELGAPRDTSARETLDVAAASPSGAATPDMAEIDYARATAAGIFRRRSSQRSTAFIPIDGPGYGLCLRTPAKSGKGYDHALIVFSRRLHGAPISQVDDDTIVYRRAADAAPCRRGSIGWVRLVG